MTLSLFNPEKREKRKSIVIFPIGKGKAQDQENPGLAKKRGRKPKAITSKNKNNINK